MINNPRDSEFLITMLIEMNQHLTDIKGLLEKLVSEKENKKNNYPGTAIHKAVIY